MRLTCLALLGFAGRLAQAYLDTSPFFVFSSNNLDLPSSELQSGHRLTSDILSALSHCPSDIYILINQAGISLSDFPSPAAAPTLERHLGHSEKLHVFAASIPEVAGQVDFAKIEEQLESHCYAAPVDVDASGKLPKLPNFEKLILRLNFAAPADDQPQRAKDIINNDKVLASLLNHVPHKNYTLLYTTSPLTSYSNPADENPPYEMSDSSSLHTDLKRDLADRSSKHSSNNVTLVDGPLFARYQFLTPGLFMGLMVSFLLLTILYVAISGIASLQVSYAAFDKENGPAANQKRGQ